MKTYLLAVVDRVGWDRVSFVVAVVPFVAFCVAHVDYFPLWDGLLYYNCVLEGSRRTISPFAYYCYYHPTIAYMWPLGILQTLAYGRYEAVIVFNIALGLLALRLYSALVQMVLPDAKARSERFLAVALLASFPVFVSSAIQLNPDYAVLVSFLGIVLALARDRLGVAIAWGLVAVLCKETGVVLYCLATATYVLVFFVASGLSFAEKRRCLARQVVLLVVPLFTGLTAFVLYRKLGAAGFWAGDKGIGLGELLSMTSIVDRRLATSLATMFVLGFMWLPSMVMALGGVAGFLGVVVRRRPLATMVARFPPDRLGLFLVLLLLGTVVVLCLPRTVVNVRYYLPIYPLIFLLSTRTLMSLISSRLLRCLVLGAVVSLILTSNVRSFDPISRQLYSTISFGRHALYRITSFTRECCGLGRDQLAYNLQFAQFHYLINDILADVFRDPETALAMNKEGNWYIIAAVDRRTLKRAAPSEETFSPTVFNIETLAKLSTKPSRLLYIELPNMDEAGELQSWAELYRIGPARTYERHGYALRVRELALK